MGGGGVQAQKIIDKTYTKTWSKLCFSLNDQTVNQTI